MGRPSNFKAEYIEQAYKLALLGLKDTEIAKFFGITEKTLNNWKEKHPEFFQSLKKGKIIADGEIVKSLYNRALGSKVKIQQAYKVKSIDYEDGKKVSEKEEIKIVELTQEVPPDTTACIFWLKNRQPEQWRDKVEHSVDNDVTTQDVFLKHLKEL
jgi:hypothetical protein